MRKFEVAERVGLLMQNKKQPLVISLKNSCSEKKSVTKATLLKCNRDYKY